MQVVYSAANETGDAALGHKKDCMLPCSGYEERIAAFENSEQGTLQR